MILRSQKRESHTLFTVIISLLLGVIGGATLMAVVGCNPITGYRALLLGGVKVGNTLELTTSLILVGLSVALALKTGLYNFGATGQMLVGGMCASFVALKALSLPPALYIIILIASALLGGAIWGAIAGLLKAQFHVHEALSTLLMNWIAFWLVSFFAPIYIFEADSLALDMVSLPWLTELFRGSSVSLLFFVAILAVFTIKWILNRTTLGFKLKAVGLNRECAKYAGIKVATYSTISMMVAGSLAGLAGLSFSFLELDGGKLPSLGFEGIAIALVSMSNPIGILVSSFFFGILQSGKSFMHTMTNIPLAIIDTITMSMILFMAVSMQWKPLWEVLARRLFRKKQNKRAKSPAFEQSRKEGL